MNRYVIEIPSERVKTDAVVADGLRKIAQSIETKEPTGFLFTVEYKEENTTFENKLVKQIKLVRELQNKYFSSRSKFVLNDVKKAERLLDKMIEDREKELKSPTLF